MKHPMLRASALAMALALASGGAWAQSMIQNAVPPTDAKKAMANEARATRRPDEPPALPGALESRGGAAPAGAQVLSMSPQEALFDAVNRGDVPAARDALSRGADIDGRNELGLSAVELAIDLGRNDMTFLLLSLRSAAPGARAAIVASSAKAGAPAALARPARIAAVTPVAVRAAPASPPPVRYTADPGTPVPQAGFLGFGGTHQ